ncbi:MAG: short-subunit dehydrogenase [Candidatus Saccharimonadales bacterium]|jgi:short-subunit dehydrogenase
MRTIVITGASDGIGREIAIRLSKDDYKLVLLGRNEDRLKAVADQCSDATFHAFDLNDNAARNKVVEQLLAVGVDVLINNAGIWQKLGGLETLSDKDAVEILNTNLVSQILLTKAFLPSMKSKKGSAIVNVISKSGVQAQAGQSVYTASKYGMRGFTDVLREDTKDDNIHIAGVYQSGTNTEMFEKAGDKPPVETFTEPEDLADVIAYILSRPDKLWVEEIRIDR